METLKDKPELLEELWLSANLRESELLMGQTQLKVGVFNGPPNVATTETSFRERIAQGRTSIDRPRL
jgi:hypothetical protein